MKINDLKRGVHDALLTQTFDDYIDHLIVSCILYSHLEKILAQENKNQNNSRQLAESYSQIFISNFIEYKSSAVAYNVIRATIQGYRKTSFLDFSSFQIEEIRKLYDNKTSIVPFSISKFSQYMYKIAYIKHNDYNNLARIHSEVMIPIARFYMNEFNLDSEDLEILTAEDYTLAPGKVIIFSIKNIAPARVLNDIKTRKIPINYHSIEMLNTYIKLITN